MMKPILWFENTRRLMFGKYEGEPVWDIISKDPNYIIYCLENVDRFELTENEKSRLRYIRGKQEYERNRRRRNAIYWHNFKYGGGNYGGGYGCGDRNLYG